jgi:hypothetical protein
VSFAKLAELRPPPHQPAFAPGTNVATLATVIASAAKTSFDMLIAMTSLEVCWKRRSSLAAKRRRFFVVETDRAGA